MWYSVEALFCCNIQNEIRNKLYDKTIFLIKVKEKDNEKQALKKAKLTARKFENTYKNHLNEKVTWKLVKVLQIQNLVKSNIYDGMEVFSQLMWERDVPKELRKIKKKEVSKKSTN